MTAPEDEPSPETRPSGAPPDAASTQPPAQPDAPSPDVVSVKPPAPRPNYFDMFNDRDAKHHPVDAAAERRLHHAELSQRIAELQDRIHMKITEHEIWLELDECRARERTEREHTYFNLGYELGRLEGRAERIAVERQSQLPPAPEAVARRVRATLALSELTTQQQHRIAFALLAALVDPPDDAPAARDWEDASDPTSDIGARRK